ncbi:MAG: FecR domain-containing protein, partial [Gammaproteobacteria bacterium]|nr:FecR domain-containing protein [Gammaproteobacteria bacterium]
MSRQQRIVAFCVAVSAFLLLLHSPSTYSQTTPVWVATLISAEGTVEARRASQTEWIHASLDDTFAIGDSVRVLAYGRAGLLLPGETVLRLDQNTTITFEEPDDDARSWVELFLGVIHVISREPRSLQVLTPFANAGLEGTEFLVQVTTEEATITVFEGEVAFSNSNGEVSVSTGQRVSARIGQAPVSEPFAQGVQPRDAVQWTLYYPPILTSAQNADDDPEPHEVNDPQFFTGRAAQLLSVGRVDETIGDLDTALGLDSNNADERALRSIIAVTQNDKNVALTLATEAVAYDPNSATALIALSYAYQALFDTSGALSNLQAAVEREPNNALAWARLSELWLAVGDLDEALTAAQTAASLDPGTARTQTVLGFAYLTRLDLEQATAAFRTAITLDQAAPLPRLGLGLAMIRDGDLAAGRGEIEIAVILDPGNALVRSYVGKAYYDERRDELAESQLAIAKDLDPLDPTPWFYNAILNLTGNRPVDALQDIQDSIKKNDNRAVYRSRLLLDEDLAARSASLGRIYDDLGFEQLALLEGWKSINSDPGSHSGHRLLADTFSTLPRHEIARANELFQSQLLQPLNITPVQAQLAESNLFILDSAGPAALSFNEFNPLFNRNRVAFQASGVTGGNGTRGEDIAVAGVSDRWSYSLGQFHFETDGFRANNDLEQDVLNAFVQFRPSEKTSLLAELRSSERDQGDLSLLFNP